MRTHPWLTSPALAVLAVAAFSGAARGRRIHRHPRLQPGTAPTQIGGRTATQASYTAGAGAVMTTATTLSAGGGSAFTYAAGVDDAQGALAVVRYYINAVGPAGVLVPVRVLASGYAEGTGLDGQGNHYYFASAEFTLRTDTPIFADTNTNRGNGRQTFAIDTIAYLMANTEYAVDRRAAVETISQNADAERLASSYAIPLLSHLGDLDAAFRQAERYSRNPKVLRLAFAMQPDFLFGPDTIAMRADPRLIPLVRRLGLLDYWRATGRWPDFCVREPKSVCGEMKRSPPALTVGDAGRWGSTAFDYALRLGRASAERLDQVAAGGGSRRRVVPGASL